MNKKEERYIIIGLILAILACLASWVSIPQIQNILSSKNTQSSTNELKLSGTWKGRTAQGDDIYFEINGDKVTNLTTTFPVYVIKNSAPCPTRGTVVGGEAYIDSNSFLYVTDYSVVPIEIKGEFKSGILAEGTMYAPNQPSFSGECGIFSTTWQAKKQ